jgi:hypothetical protein
LVETGRSGVLESAFFWISLFQVIWAFVMKHSCHEHCCHWSCVCCVARAISE